MMKIYKYITILLIACWAFSADEMGVSLWLPTPIFTPLPAWGLPSSYGDQTMRPHFEMIDDLSF